MQSNPNTVPEIKRVMRTLAVLVFGMASLLYTLGNGGHSLWDRDEARFSEATREMIETGDWIIPHLNGEIRYDKPILIYWLMSLPMRLGGVNEFSARFPSALAGALTVLLVFLMAERMGFGLSGSVVAAAAAMSSALLFVVSKAATTDATLTLTVTAAMFLYWEQRRRGFSWWRHLAFWVVLGLSALVKGPPGVAVVGLAVMCDKAWTLWTFRRENRPPVRSPHSALSTQHSALNTQPSVLSPQSSALSTQHSALNTQLSVLSPQSSALSTQHSALLCFCAGLAAFALVTLPWGWAAWQRTNGEFLRVAFGHHVMDRARESFEGHKGPFFYYVALLPLLVFPMTAVLLNAVRWAAGAAARRNAAVRLLWCWILPGLVVFSLVKTKLPHYMAPMLPALALMMGGWWAALEKRRRESKDAKDARDTKDPNDTKGLGGAKDRPSAEEAAVIPGTVWWCIGAVLMAALGVGVGIAVLLAPVLLFMADFSEWIGQERLIAQQPIFEMIPVISLVWGMVLSLALLGGAHFWWRMRPRLAIAWWFGGMLVANLILLAFVLPALEPMRPSKQIGQYLRENAPPGTYLMAAIYKEPSLMFYARRGMQEMGKDDFEEAIARLGKPDSPAALVATRPRWEKWLAAYAKPLPPRVSVRLQKSFYDFQKGKPLELVVVGNW
jgi:hypothetical protein